MSKYKLSPWHDGSVKPVHKGVYETGITPGWYRKWDGKQWICGSTTVDGAKYERAISLCQFVRWRGILKD